jgi:dihydrofolate reductase
LRKIIIAAVAKNWVIGRSNGEMPWHSKEDFQHFKKTTLGFTVIMGRKTFESLGMPLKDRLNIVVSNNKNYNPGFEGVKLMGSLKEAYNYCKAGNYEKVFVLGGGYIFKEAVNSVDEMILSHMDFDAVGDVYFPKFNLNDWEITKRDKRNDFEIIYYVRKN